MSSERSFFQAMEEFGFFAHIYEKLPPEFTAVFEIARVIEDETSPLHQQLRDILRLPALQMGGNVDRTQDFHRYAPAGEEYIADMIRSHHDVSRIYPTQFLLPDEIFMERLALRELWMPVAKHPKILPVDEVDLGFKFDSRKQKVYVLFDTSQSMASHHRIHLAKAILYHFLKRNKEELGYISLRTFDDHVGELHTAVDQSSYDALMRHVLRLSHLGEGTVLQRALLQALDDIQAMEHLSGAEILIITDGAVSIDEDLVRSKMDEHILIHTVKIGHAQIYASDAQLNDMIMDGKIKDQQLQDLIKQEADVLYKVRHTQSEHKHGDFENMLAGVRRQIAQRKHELSTKLGGIFGHEIERLSGVFVNIDDFNETERFRADPETIADLEQLAAALEADAKEFVTPETTKKLAILHDHVQFLLKYETNSGLKQRLETIDEHLRKLLAGFMGHPEATGENGEPVTAEGESQASQLPLSEEDMRDLQFLLDGDLSMDTNWGKMLRYLWKMMVQRVAQWRKRRKQEPPKKADAS